MGFHLRVLHVGPQKAEQILCSREIFVRAVYVHAAVPLIMVIGMVAVHSQHGHYADEHHALSEYIGNRNIPGLLVIGSQGENTLAQGYHHIFCGCFHYYVTDKICGKCTAECQAFFKFCKLICIRKFSEQKQVCNFFKTISVFSHYTANQIIDIITSVK